MCDSLRPYPWDQADVREDGSPNPRYRPQPFTALPLRALAEYRVTLRELAENIGLIRHVQA
jgi:hypothetical protein